MAAIAYHSSCDQLAYADHRRDVPAGSRIDTGDGKPIVTGQPYWLVSRSQIDRANTSAAMERRLSDELERCSSELEDVREPASAWAIGVVAAAWGITIGAAFVAGLAVM
jgi:hypothetical protein